MTHNETNIDKLIAEWKLLYGDTPVTIWWDRNKRRYVSHEAMSHKNTEFTYIRRFDMVGTFNINTHPEEIKKWMRETEKLNKFETPIPGSLGKHVEGMRTEDKWEE